MPNLAILDLSKNEQLLDKFCKELMSRDPLLWASKAKTVKEVHRLSAEWGDKGGVIQNLAPIFQAIRKRYLLEPKNFLHLLEAMEAHFKYEKQKMNLRQALRDNPLREISPLDLASTLVNSENLGIKLFDEMKKIWQQYDKNWYQHFLLEPSPVNRGFDTQTIQEYPAP